MSKLTTAQKNSIKNAVQQKQNSKKNAQQKQTVDKKQTAEAKQTVSEAVAEAEKTLNSVKRFQNVYNIISDSRLFEQKADVEKKASCDDTYLHIFRHNTDSSLNVLQCFFKHSKKQVYVLANMKQFEAFNTDVEHVVAHKSRIRYYVSYEQFTAFIESILDYDTHRLTATATQTAEATAEAK